MLTIRFSVAVPIDEQLPSVYRNRLNSYIVSTIPMGDSCGVIRSPLCCRQDSKLWHRTLIKFLVIFLAVG